MIFSVWLDPEVEHSVFDLDWPELLDLPEVFEAEGSGLNSEQVALVEHFDLLLDLDFGFVVGQNRSE